LGENWNVYGLSVTIDSIGNIYVGGFGDGHPDYPIYGNYDAFIEKFSPEGVLLWTKVIGTSSYDEIVSIDVASDNSILVVGNSNGNIDHIKTGENNTDIFVANYDSSGSQRWIYQYGTAAEDHAQSLAAGQNGTFYISGYTSGSLDGEANSNNELNNFLAAFKFNASPTFVSSNLLIDNQYFNTKDNITLSFNEAITKNLDSDAGVILLKQGSKIIETFNRTKFTINDNAITINPKNDLSYNTAYTLEIGAGLINNITDSPLENESYAINFETTDTFSTSLNKYTLNSSVAFARNILYTGTSHFSGTGNSYNNLITGGIGNDILDGRSGIDTLIGGLGNDTYIVDTSFDVITENINEGIDVVKSSVSYELSSNIENLTLIGSKNINGAGNSLSNIITGNNGNNKLDGGLGDNTLIGGKGNDTYIAYINDVVIASYQVIIIICF
jgi:Ca2+-binding RTX toxin-like protein